MNVEWETNWSYRQADVKAGDVNHALTFESMHQGQFEQRDSFNSGMFHVRALI
jgi:hypothetical protein